MSGKPIDLPLKVALEGPVHLWSANRRSVSIVSALLVISGSVLRRRYITVMRVR
jgi:hypothetical protein